ncbi:Tetratricopeptide repeat-domain-containing protein [Aspergillus pseudonomiae]|nr:Tetratricopeptide repeat-domain-containing protein [Aspergillus pseudonomiae]
MTNLASTYRHQGRCKEAEELGLQVMELRKQVLGPEHPGTLTSMANLAYTWNLLGKAQDALALMEKCVELRRNVLGPDNPHTISSSKALRDWQIAVNSPSKHSTQQTPAEVSPALPIHNHPLTQKKSDPEPLTSGKRRTFVRFFRRR